MQEFLHYSCTYILRSLNTETLLSQVQVQPVFPPSTLVHDRRGQHTSSRQCQEDKPLSSMQLQQDPLHCIPTRGEKK